MFFIGYYFHIMFGPKTDIDTDCEKNDYDIRLNVYKFFKIYE